MPFNTFHAQCSLCQEVDTCSGFGWDLRMPTTNNQLLLNFTDNDNDNDSKAEVQ